MAIAFDTTANAKANGSVSWSHTCTGSNLILVVCIASFNQSASAVSYNGVALTKQKARANGTLNSEIWTLVNPATGAHTVSVTLPSSSWATVGGSVSATGVDQVTPIDASAASVSEATTTTPSLSITTVSANTLVVDSIYSHNNGITSCSQILDWSAVQGTTSGAGSHKAVTAIGATTTGWTLASPDNNWAMVSVALKAAAAAITTNALFYGAD